MFLPIHADGVRRLVALAYDENPCNKIDAIKALRAWTGFGLKQSKDLIEAEEFERNPRGRTIDSVLAEIVDQQFPTAR